MLSNSMSFADSAVQSSVTSRYGIRANSASVRVMTKSSISSACWRLTHRRVGHRERHRGSRFRPLLVIARFPDPVRYFQGDGRCVSGSWSGSTSIWSDRVGRRDVALLEPELLEHDVARLRDRRGLVEREVPVEALAAEAAVGREDELVGRDVLERAPDAVGDDLREVGLERAVADHADRDLLLQRVACTARRASISLRSFSVASIVQTSPLSRSR